MDKLFRPDYLKKMCREYGFKPGRKYGQNFLIDPAVITRIMAAADIHPEETVVEVGPGFGTLTFALSGRAKKVLAFEIEKKLQPYWEKSPDNVELVWGNVLKEFPKFVPGEPYAVAANLPYQITAAVIRLFLETEPPPVRLILMVQKEVAERLGARPGEMSVLTVATQYYAEVETLFTVPRSSFSPAPRVDSAVVRIVPRKQNRDKNFDQKFFQTVKAGFANRRKLLSKNLAALAPVKDVRPALQALSLSPTARAQELSVEEWVSLTERLSRD